MESRAPGSEDQGEPRGPSLYLIDNTAEWSACFGPFLDPDFVLKSYTVNAWNLGKFTANLTCGNSISKSSGWHHIQARHQPQWQARLDDAKAAGAGPADTWDDLMARRCGDLPRLAVRGRFDE